VGVVNDITDRTSCKYIFLAVVQYNSMDNSLYSQLGNENCRACNTDGKHNNVDVEESTICRYQAEETKIHRNGFALANGAIVDRQSKRV